MFPKKWGLSLPHYANEETEAPASYGCTTGNEEAETGIPARNNPPSLLVSKKGAEAHGNAHTVRKKAPHPHLQDLPAATKDQRVREAK